MCKLACTEKLKRSRCSGHSCCGVASLLRNASHPATVRVREVPNSTLASACVHDAMYFIEQAFNPLYTTTQPAEH